MTVRSIWHGNMQHETRKRRDTATKCRQSAVAVAIVEQGPAKYSPHYAESLWGQQASRESNNFSHFGANAACVLAFSPTSPLAHLTAGWQESAGCSSGAHRPAPELSYCAGTGVRKQLIDDPPSDRRARRPVQCRGGPAPLSRCVQAGATRRARWGRQGSHQSRCEQAGRLAGAAPGGIFRGVVPCATLFLRPVAAPLGILAVGGRVLPPLGILATGEVPPGAGVNGGRQARRQVHLPKGGPQRLPLRGIITSSPTPRQADTLGPCRRHPRGRYNSIPM
eukprot:scaffold14508_cov112-Isochrysis_galbana.AAC.2